MMPKIFITVLVATLAVMNFGCGSANSSQSSHTAAAPSPIATKKPEPGDELLSEKNSSTGSSIGKSDFRNFTYQIPRGWQDADGEEVKLIDGKRPLSEKEEKIGFEYVTTKFFDVTGDGQDEAAVVLRIDTGGASIPQIVYVFEWKNGGPELIWRFRTGDRADAGIKNLYADNGEFVLELFGQDRYVLGDVETARITGDEDDICCPTNFTLSRYKYSGNAFRLIGKRLTYKVSDPLNHPQENLGESMNKTRKK